MNVFLTVLYLLTFATVVSNRDAFVDHDLAAAAAAAFLLIGGLALWVWSIRRRPRREDGQ